MNKGNTWIRKLEQSHLLMYLVSADHNQTFNFPREWRERCMISGFHVLNVVQNTYRGIRINTKI